MSNKFLFELGLEEIPAGMLPNGLEQLETRFRELLSEHKLEWDEYRTYSSPRRLAVLFEGLPERQPDQERMIMGPPLSVAVDAQGNATRAAEGFAKKLGATVGELETVETERGPYLACRQRLPGRAVFEILQELAPQVVSSIAWPKNMYWRESRFRFVRPIRWIVALWNDLVIPLEFEGVASGNVTRGHRFLGAARIELPNVDGYADQLRANYVIPSTEERLGKITGGIEALEAETGMVCRPDPALLETVVNLVEYPSVILGSFDAEFLRIPREVLSTVMRYHQKYFSLENRDGEIQPHFLAVLNTDGDPEGEIRRGHEKVLKARLEDGAFFWDTDRKASLVDRLPLLEHVLFQEKLGSYLQKTERVRALCRDLGGDDSLDQAARLCKVDLTTEMVRELTELQGIMGGLYAREEGYPEAVWRAIYEHYAPISLTDATPSLRTGAQLSIADRLDTVVGCFGIGVVPTGSSDPFGLRRQAQGLVKILRQDAERFSLDYSLPRLVEAAQKNFPEVSDPEQVRRDVLEFLTGRVRFILSEEGFPYDILNAVLSIGVDRVYQTFRRAQALQTMKGEEDFEALAVAFKRIKNILSKQPIEFDQVRESALVEPEEVELHRGYLELKERVESDLAKPEPAYLSALKQIAALRDRVDRFFDKVLVMAEEAQQRNNRLRLLFEISQLFLRIADISEIVSKD